MRSSILAAGVLSGLGLHLLDSRIPVSLAAVERPFTALPVILALLLVAGAESTWGRQRTDCRLV